MNKDRRIKSFYYFSQGVLEGLNGKTKSLEERDLLFAKILLNEIMDIQELKE
jgi:hypothetical protein